MNIRLVICLTGLLSSVMSQASAFDQGCTLRQFVADQEFIITDGIVNQEFVPCQSGVLEFVNIDAQSATEETFGIRLSLFEMVDGEAILIHQQQGVAPSRSLDRKTVFSITKDVQVAAEGIYRMQLEVPKKHEMIVRFSGIDALDNGCLAVNNARFSGDLAFEVGVNPLHLYKHLQEEIPEVKQWELESQANDANLSIVQASYNTSELMSNASYSQTFVTEHAARLTEIWFHGDFIHVETQIPVHLYDRGSDVYMGYAILEIHESSEHTLVARFEDTLLNADTRYEFFVDCGERQQLNMRIITEPQFFVGEFKEKSVNRDANFSFIAFME